MEGNLFLKVEPILNKFPEKNNKIHNYLGSDTEKAEKFKNTNH